MIVADSPGMGKSIVLTHLSREIKKRDAKFWIFRIRLTADILMKLANGLTGRDKSDCKFFTEFFVLKTPFEKDFFKTIYEDQKLLLFFDGVNETGLEEKTVYGPLENISKSKYGQLWMTTRLHLQKKLETNFKTKSLEMEKFSKPDQVNFLVNFWSKLVPKTEVDIKRLNMYANELIEKLAASFQNDIKSLDFIGIPLQTRMIAEIFRDDVIKAHSFKIPSISQSINSIIDLNWLYKQFLGKKIFLWISEYRTSSTIERADFMKHGWAMHQRLAIQAYFREKQVRFCDRNVLHYLRFKVLCALKTKML